MFRGRKAQLIPMAKKPCQQCGLKHWCAIRLRVLNVAQFLCFECWRRKYYGR